MSTKPNNEDNFLKKYHYLHSYSCPFLALSTVTQLNICSCFLSSPEKEKLISWPNLTNPPRVNCFYYFHSLSAPTNSFPSDDRRCQLFLHTLPPVRLPLDISSQANFFLLQSAPSILLIYHISRCNEKRMTIMIISTYQSQ